MVLMVLVANVTGSDVDMQQKHQTSTLDDVQVIPMLVLYVVLIRVRVLLVLLRLTVMTRTHLSIQELFGTMMVMVMDILMEQQEMDVQHLMDQVTGTSLGQCKHETVMTQNQRPIVEQ